MITVSVWTTSYKQDKGEITEYL